MGRRWVVAAVAMGLAGALLLGYSFIRIYAYARWIEVPGQANLKLQSGRHAVYHQYRHMDARMVRHESAPGAVRCEIRSATSGEAVELLDSEGSYPYAGSGIMLGEFRIEEPGDYQVVGSPTEGGKSRIIVAPFPRGAMASGAGLILLALGLGAALLIARRRRE
jgi:hypothetical protein